ncbi:hypothetical protein DWUX_1539 [Desulfovibrio diazotrophicus]|nr:hypothetical protein DWUX_1539 [Desulfovibrio diazotrophicus]
MALSASGLWRLWRAALAGAQTQKQDAHPGLAPHNACLRFCGGRPRMRV